MGIGRVGAVGKLFSASADAEGVVSNLDDVRGHTGNDLLIGGNPNDKLCGDEDDDTLLGGNSRDYLCGWTGTDDDAVVSDIEELV
ncbi:MAG: hypothetical protein AAGD32_10285 [Planctomycetota bacterium]